MLLVPASLVDGVGLYYFFCWEWYRSSDIHTLATASMMMMMLTAHKCRVISCPTKALGESDI